MCLHWWGVWVDVLLRHSDSCVEDLLDIWRRASNLCTQTLNNVMRSVSLSCLSHLVNAYIGSHMWIVRFSVFLDHGRSPAVFCLIRHACAYRRALSSHCKLLVILGLLDDMGRWKGAHRNLGTSNGVPKVLLLLLSLFLVLKVAWHRPVYIIPKVHFSGGSTWPRTRVRLRHNCILWRCLHTFLLVFGVRMALVLRL